MFSKVIQNYSTKDKTMNVNVTRHILIILKIMLFPQQYGAD